MIELKDLNVESEEVVNTTPEESPVIVDETPIKKEIKKLNETGVVINGKLNMRKRPSVKSEVIQVLNDKSEVIILPCKDNTFYKVKFGDLEGYCMKKFIKKVK